MRGSCFLRTLVLGAMAWIPIKVVSIVDVQVVAILYFLIVGIVGDKSVFIIIEIRALACRALTYLPHVNSLYSSHARSQFEESGAIELTMTV